jgi:hypothetical protein
VAAVTAPLLDGPALARSLGRPEQTLRAWAAAGLITRRGKDAQGRTLYDVDEVIGVSSARQRRHRSLSTTDGSTTRLPGASTSD